ncbi:hypothetical protein B0H14DRAFT_3436283 [Mycena olivaceomarginata]|nr:hypothetical protein B0H14DRAFT_3436283 [Mycena olivaceomarginata]
MCAFFGTLRRSSLGARVTALRMRGVVPSFHGHAHNRECQLGWHLLYSALPKELIEFPAVKNVEACVEFVRHHMAIAARKILHDVVISVMDTEGIQVVRCISFFVLPLVLFEAKYAWEAFADVDDFRIL